MTYTPTYRDFLMARVAAARASLVAGIEACDEITALCLEPEDDRKLADRKEALEDALEQAGAAARALECGESMIELVDPKEGEPWEEDDEEPEIEIPRATARKRRS